MEFPILLIIYIGQVDILNLDRHLIQINVIILRISINYQIICDVLVIMFVKNFLINLVNYLPYNCMGYKSKFLTLFK